MVLNVYERKEVVDLEPSFWNHNRKRWVFSHSGCTNENMQRTFTKLLLVGFHCVRCKVHMWEKDLIDEYSSTAHGSFGGTQVNIVVRKKSMFWVQNSLFKVTLINLNLMTLPRHWLTDKMTEYSKVKKINHISNNLKLHQHKMISL